MKTIFSSPDFLLTNRAARRLYHDHAADLPIVDYHTHLPQRLIADNHAFTNLTDIWLRGDHYKWRVMRANGVAERFITGDATDREKFQHFAETMPYTLRNPIFHWSHMELRKPFGISDRLLDGRTAESVWRKANQRLATPGLRCRGLLAQWDVRVVCTTDDPVDDLADHARIAQDRTCKVAVYPTFRPDRALAVDQPAVFRAWLEKLETASGLRVRRFDDLLVALSRRAEFFHQHGCRLSDHGLEQLYASDFTPAQLERALRAARSGRAPAPVDVEAFRSAVLLELGRLYARLGWTQQFHLGPLRNVNTRLRTRIGADAGCDTIGDFTQAAPLARFLDALDRDDRLPRTILYNLNPRDNDLMATMIGNFQDGSVPGKIQFGSGWWFLDQKHGIEAQLDALSNMGLLSRFVGMLTDSRSFLSYSRHEYFRRVLCDKLGTEIEQGLLPRDFAWIGGLVQDVCFRNAASFFNWPRLVT
jgi:glucuronate isomerase